MEKILFSRTLKRKSSFRDQLWLGKSFDYLALGLGIQCFWVTWKSEVWFKGKASQWQLQLEPKFLDSLFTLSSLRQEQAQEDGLSIS